jgi:hypothetical protein
VSWLVSNSIPLNRDAILDDKAATWTDRSVITVCHRTLHGLGLDQSSRNLILIVVQLRFGHLWIQTLHFTHRIEIALSRVSNRISHTGRVLRAWRHSYSTTLCRSRFSHSELSVLAECSFRGSFWDFWHFFISCLTNDSVAMGIDWLNIFHT